MRKLQKYCTIVSILCSVLLCGCGRQEELLLLQAGEADGSPEASVSWEPAESIAVYVCGEVEQPGVVYLTEGARVVDALAAAGGFTDSADSEYVNLAAHVSDGEKLYVPNREEGQELRSRQAEEEAGFVNINTADETLLMTLPGIGESRAGDIIAYRSEHGEFSSIEELMKIPGIKEHLFAKIKDKIIAE